jgi:hypothetical protein
MHTPAHRRRRSRRPLLLLAALPLAALAVASLFAIAVPHSRTASRLSAHDAAYRVSEHRLAQQPARARAVRLVEYLAALQKAKLIGFLSALLTAQAAEAAQQSAAAAAAAPVSSVPAAANPSGDTVTPYQRAAWDRVNMCEEGGVWNMDGPVYSGGLGFTHTNWAQFNTFGFPADAADATPDQQIQVATAFAAHYYGSPDAAPDQDGCGSGY